MQATHVIGFIPPVLGIEKEFNTVRLGTSYAKKLKAGDEVFLLDEKEKAVFGRAEVISVETGDLGEICLAHGSKNHTEVGKIDAENMVPERLFALMTKIYGPHIATPKKKATVLYLKRIE